MTPQFHQFDASDGWATFWRVIDEIRAQEGVSLEVLSKRLGYSRSCLQKRRERKNGSERLHEAAAVLAAMGWELRLAACKAQD